MYSIIVLYFNCLIFTSFVAFYNSSRSALTTFNPEKMKITLKREKRDIRDETIHLLKTHFIGKNRFTNEDWDKFRKEMEDDSDIHTAVSNFVKKMNDPYTRFIGKSVMRERKHQIRGVSVGVGLIFARKLHMEELIYTVKRFLHKKEMSNFEDQSFGNINSKLFQNRENLIENTTESKNINIYQFSKNIRRNIFFIAPLLLPVILRRQLNNLHRNWLHLSCSLTLVAKLTTDLYPIVFPIEVVENFNSKDVQVGDRLISIDDKKIGLKSIKTINKYINTGNIGDPLNLKLSRSETAQNISNNNYNPRIVYNVKMMKEYLVENTVSWLALPATQGCGVGYLSIREFSDETFQEVKTGLEKLRLDILEQQGHPLHAIIIDLRSNPGGPLVPALDVASLFLPRGKVLLQMSVSRGLEKHRSKNRRADLKTSILLLSDSKTASASEILIEALCDNGRAKCMGTKTVGKNVAQAIMTLSDGSGICFTVREFFTPTGRSMGYGHQPFYNVEEFLSVDRIFWDHITNSWGIF